MATVVSAVEMGARQREISVSEFFTKNRHLLGFDNPRKALLTCVKEAVDNALDASEEAGILPDVVVAVEMGARQREISVSEFFTKNRHLLGFDNPSKALLTTIKEAVDNSLDACEEAGILPELHIEVHDLALEAAKPKDAELTKGEGRFLVVVQDLSLIHI